MKVANGNVSYFGSIVDYIILNMIQEKDTGDLFVTFEHGVGLLGYQTRAFSVIAGSGQRGFNDGSFTQMQFNFPHSIKFLNSHTLLVYLQPQTESSGSHHQHQLLYLLW